eukprot:SAG31_NODE_30_length_32545_cov_9.378999_18_plen_44_part_00
MVKPDLYEWDPTVQLCSRFFEALLNLILNLVGSYTRYVNASKL